MPNPAEAKFRKGGLEVRKTTYSAEEIARQTTAYLQTPASRAFTACCTAPPMFTVVYSAGSVGPAVLDPEVVLRSDGGRLRVEYVPGLAPATEITVEDEDGVTLVYTADDGYGGGVELLR